MFTYINASAQEKSRMVHAKLLTKVISEGGIYW